MSLDANSPNRNSKNDRLLVGVEALAAEAGVPERTMYHWVTTGRVQSAVKRGALWTAARNRFRRELGLD
jgi:hypothetical protein